MRVNGNGQVWTTHSLSKARTKLSEATAVHAAMKHDHNTSAWVVPDAPWPNNVAALIERYPDTPASSDNLASISTIKRHALMSNTIAGSLMRALVLAELRYGTWRFGGTIAMMRFASAAQMMRATV